MSHYNYAEKHPGNLTHKYRQEINKYRDILLPITRALSSLTEQSTR